MRFQILGILARAAYAVRRWGWAIGVLAVVGLFVGKAITADAWLNRGGVRQVTVQEAATNRVAAGTFVTIRGELYRRGLIEQTKGRSRQVTGVYTPLRDPSGNMQLLVSTRARIASHDGVVTGMLRPAPKGLRDYLRTNSGAADSGPVNQDLVLVAGQTPRALATGIMMIAISAIVLLLAALARSRCIVFTGEEEQPDGTPLPANHTLDLRVSGSFTLADMSTRLTEAPAEARLMEDGSLGFVANVVISRSAHYGVFVKTTSYAGAGVRRRLAVRGHLEDGPHLLRPHGASGDCARTRWRVQHAPRDSQLRVGRRARCTGARTALPVVRAARRLGGNGDRISGEVPAAMRSPRPTGSDPPAAGPGTGG